MNKNERFVSVYTEDAGPLYGSFIVFVDKMTGVNYLVSSSGSGGARTMTPLLDVDGKPVITRV